MGKNRLERAFKPAQDTSPPSQDGGEGFDRHVAAMLQAIPGNYLALSVEQARWTILEEYARADDVKSVWNDKRFQALDAANVVDAFVIALPPAYAHHLTAFAQQAHYDELVRRIMANPDAMRSYYPECTTPEVMAFLIETFDGEGLQSALHDGQKQLLAMIVYCCLERIYGMQKAAIYYSMQIAALDAEAKEPPQESPLARQCWKFVQQHCDPLKLTGKQRQAAGIALDVLRTNLISERWKHQMLENLDTDSPIHTLLGVLKTTAKAASALTKYETWEGWLQEQGGES